MPRRLLASLILLAGCAGSEPPATGRSLQAVSLDPPLFVLGAPGDRLGAALTTCATGQVLGAAPGRPGLWTLDAGVLEFPVDAGRLSGSIACVSGPDTWFAAAGPDGLARRSPAGAWQMLASGPILSLAAGPTAAHPLLVGRPTGEVQLFHASTGSFTNQTLWAEGPAESLGWFSDGTGLLLGTPSLSAVDVWAWDAGAGPSLTATLFLLNGFGRALATGNVSPRPGLELIIATRGEVYVLDAAGSTITVLNGTSDSFGTALALSPSEYAGLDALWVGEPGTGRLHRFIGDAGQDLTPALSLPSGAGFGSSLAFTRGSLYVGAPDASPGGAVVISAVQVTPATKFDLVECAPGSCQRGSCLGVCVGGVVCDYELCPRPDAGLADAGRPDAGPPDAGSTEADAGTSDAGPGETDAGAQDAGALDAGGADAGARPDAGASEPVLFSSSGCANVPGLPLALVALLTLRRKRLAGAR